MAIIKLNNQSISAISALPAGVGGKVLQVVSTTKDTTFATTSDTMVDITGMSISITPSSSSNKILISYNVFVGANNSDETRINLLRNSTIIGKGNAQNTSSGTLIVDYFRMNVCSYEFLDSPTTTSAITYKLQMRKSGVNATAYVNDRGYDNQSSGSNSNWGNSVITAIEIAG